MGLAAQSHQRRHVKRTTQMAAAASANARAFFYRTAGRENTRVESSEGYPLASIGRVRQHHELPQDLERAGFADPRDGQHESITAVQLGITGDEAASFTTQLLHAILQIPLMTLSLAQHQCRKSLAAGQGVPPIALLGVHYTQALHGTRDGAQAQGCCTGRLPRFPRHACGILAKRTGIDRIALASLPQRLRELASTTWINNADFHLALSMQR